MRKTRTLGIGLVLTVVLMFIAPAATFADGGKEFETRLTGAAEIPGPGDPDGRGKVELEFAKNFSRVCYTLQVWGIAPATAAHIHLGAVGAAGPVVVGLIAPTNGKSKGCVTIDPDLGRGIVENHTAYYVNVHNADYPAGALRGQLRKTQ